MKKMEELKEMLCEELDKITKKGELSAGSLDVIDKLTHSIKSIETIIAMNEYSGDNSYARGRGRNARRDSMGRYSSDDYSMRSGANSGYNSGANSYEYSMRGGQYSGDDMTKIKEELGRLEGSIQDTRAKRMLQEFMQELH